MAELEPYWPYIVMALNGLVAGWLAGLLLGGGGLIRNLFVGIIGAFVGGLLVSSGLLVLPESLKVWLDAIPYGEQVFVSTLGAILVVLFARLVAR